MTVLMVVAVVLAGLRLLVQLLVRPACTCGAVRRRGTAPLQLPRAGVGDRAGLQRGGQHRGDRAVAGRQRLPAARGDRRRRRVHRRHRGHRRAGCGLPGVCVVRQANAGKPAALNTGIALRPRRPPGAGRRRHRLRAGRDRPAGAAVRGPARRRGLRQHQGGQPARAARPLAAPGVRDRLQPRPADVRRAAGACRPCPARSARSAARRVRRRRRRVRRDARRGHRPHDGGHPGRLAGGVRAEPRSPGPRRRRAAAAVAAALPLVLRHDAGDVEAPPRAGASAARPAGWAGAGCATCCSSRCCCR